ILVGFLLGFAWFRVGTCQSMDISSIFEQDRSSKRQCLAYPQHPLETNKTRACKLFQLDFASYVQKTSGSMEMCLKNPKQQKGKADLKYSRRVDLQTTSTLAYLWLETNR